MPTVVRFPAAALPIRRNDHALINPAFDLFLSDSEREILVNALLGHLATKHPRSVEAVTWRCIEEGTGAAGLLAYAVALQRDC